MGACTEAARGLVKTLVDVIIEIVIDAVAGFTLTQRPFPRLFPKATAPPAVTVADSNTRSIRSQGRSACLDGVGDTAAFEPIIRGAVTVVVDAVANLRDRKMGLNTDHLAVDAVPYPLGADAMGLGHTGAPALGIPLVNHTIAVVIDAITDTLQGAGTR